MRVDLIQELGRTLKEYEKYLVFYESIDFGTNGKKIIIQFNRGENLGWSFLRREMPVEDIVEILTRYKRKVAYERRKQNEASH